MITQERLDESRLASAVAVDIDLPNALRVTVPVATATPAEILAGGRDEDAIEYARLACRVYESWLDSAIARKPVRYEGEAVALALLAVARGHALEDAELVQVLADPEDEDGKLSPDAIDAVILAALGTKSREKWRWKAMAAIIAGVGDCALSPDETSACANAAWQAGTAPLWKA